MAIAVTNPVCAAGASAGFILNATSADASGCEELKAAPSAGSIIIERIIINSTSAITVTIGEGETTPGSVDTALIGPISFPVNGTFYWRFKRGMALTALKSLTVDASGAGNVCIFVEGRVE